MSTFELSDTQLLLMRQLLSASHEEAGVLKFRVLHEEERDEIDRLEALGLIEKSGGVYLLKLLSIHFLRQHSDSADNLFHLCERVYLALRESYKTSPGSRLLLGDLAKQLDMPVSEVGRALKYLVQLPISSQHTTDFSSLQAMIMPAEGVLNRKTLSSWIDFLEEITAQRAAQQAGPRPVPPPAASSAGKAQHPVNFKEPLWHRDLTGGLPQLFKEIYDGLNVGQKALPAMGMRTVLDVVCDQLVGDVGTFAEKLKRLQESGYITLRRKDVFTDTLEAWHASAHRGHFPATDALEEMLQIIESLVHELFVQPVEAKKLRASVPPRGGKSTPRKP